MGDSTSPKTTSVHVITRKATMIIHTPYFWRNFGTFLFIPTFFCTSSLTLDIGHTEHHSLPKSRNRIGSRGHRKIHTMTDPKLYVVSTLPKKSCTIIMPKTIIVGSTKIRGYQRLFRREFNGA